jgi:Domain of unknown function (DUF5018)
MNRIITSLSLLTLILISCSKGEESNAPVALSGQNSITSFMLTINGEAISGNIDQIAKTILFSVVGANLNSLKPTVLYSDSARLSPSESEAQNFNDLVSYTVFAENGDSKVYRVIIDNRPLGTENKILSFSVIINNETIEAIIDHDLKLIKFNAGTFDKTALNPTITVSEFATVSPEGNTVQNFDNTTVYTVTAENGSIAEYRVIANTPNVTGLSTIGGTFTMNPTLLYVRADIFVVGDFLDPDTPNAELYLSDGTNNFPLTILRSENYSTNEYITTYNLYTKIPNNVPTNSNYKIIYKANDFISESESFIDIVAENAPKPISLNQDSYDRNDILIITGENLTDIISIPSNGSSFIIQNSNNYDLLVNPERTELTLTLDYYYLFPSYFGNGPGEKIITLLGSDWRAGETITTVFN